MNRLFKIIALMAVVFTSPMLAAAGPHAAIEQFNDASLEEAIGKGVVVVDFYADWCGPCRKFAPTFEQVAKEMQGKAVFGKVNVDHVNKFKVRSIPTIILYKDGKEFKRKEGGSDPQALRDFVSSAL